jgi:hypothetical protein
MQCSHTTARLVSAAATVVAMTLASQEPVAAQGQGNQMTICHRTGSPTNPWVFMTIDARTWPEHQAQGDIQATSLADCAPATVAPTVAPPTVTAPTLAPTPQPSQPAVRQQQIAPGLAIPEVPVSQLRGAGTPTAVVPTPSTRASPTPPPTVEVAGVTADLALETPEISALPKSGGEPDRELLVVGLIAVAGVGMLLRRLARRRL